MGRWTAKDPIRFGGSVNLFLYANGDPVNFVDVTGEYAIALGIAAAAATVGTAIAIWGHLMNNQEALADVCKPFTIGSEGRDLDRISRDLGIPREQLRKAVEKIKKAARLRGNENVDILPDGTVVDRVSGDPIGNIHDEQGD